MERANYSLTKSTIVVVFLPYLYYYDNMTITQTVNIPADRRIVIDVPHEIPLGQVTLTFTSKLTEPNQKKDRVPGCVKGQVWMAEDFDEPLEDFKEYM